MAKKEIPLKTFFCPMPITLVGANVEGRPNFLAVAFCGTVNFDPHTIVVALGKPHYTNPGIKENGTFSLNIPSAGMARATDYCGIYSGHREDKSELFDVFYGKLGTAPMIEQAPLNLECKLIQTVELKIDEVFFGEVAAVYASEDVLDGDTVLAKKLDPMVFSMSEKKYYSIGEEIGQAWSMGKDYKKSGE